MTFIDSVVTDSPPFRYTTADIRRAAATWLSASPDQLALFDRLAGSTRIDQRAFALPLEQVLGLEGPAERAKVFEEVGGSLLESVICNALKQSKLTPADVGALVFTSCSVPAIPSIDVRVIERVGLSPGTVRLPIFQHGCAGGAIGLALSHQLKPRAGVTLLASVELCSLVYQSGDLSGGNLVGSAIFGDGAACVVLSQESGRLRIVDTESYLIPGTHHLMGYNILNDGTHLRLDRDVPTCLAETAPRLISTFLDARGLTTDDIGWWIFHPGGAKILVGLEELFKLERAQCRWAWDALRTNGNMSSASVLFALSNFLEEKTYAPGDKVIMLGVGPGLTLQVILFECVE